MHLESSFILSILLTLHVLLHILFVLKSAYFQTLNDGLTVGNGQETKKDTVIAAMRTENRRKNRYDNIFARKSPLFFIVFLLLRQIIDNVILKHPKS